MTGMTDGIYEALYGEAKYEKMRAYGFDAADFGGLCPDSSPYFAMSVPELEKALAHEKKLADDAGIVLWQAHGPWRYPPRDATDEDKQDRREHMERSIYGAALLGVKRWVIHPIMPFGLRGDDHPGVVLEQNLAFFPHIIEYAKQYGITVQFENMPGDPLFPLGSCSQILDFIEKLGGGAEVCLDTGHAATHGVQPGTEARLLGAKLGTLHVHDNNGKSDLHNMPFDHRGVIDWPDFAASLKEIGFKGVISLECSLSRKMPPAAAEYMLRAFAAMARALE